MNTDPVHNHQPTQNGKLIKGCIACNVEKNRRLMKKLIADPGVCSRCGERDCVECLRSQPVATCPKDTDMVNHPPHYTSHPSGVECIQVTEHMSFCIGNAIKYLWRADEKGSAVEDLEKARWYITREIERRKKQAL